MKWLKTEISRINLFLHLKNCCVMSFLQLVSIYAVGEQSAEATSANAASASSEANAGSQSFHRSIASLGET